MARSIQLAAQHRAKLTVVHVVHEDVPGRFVNDLLDERRAALDAELASLHPGGNLDAEVMVTWGDAFSEVVQFVERRAIDLVILGMRKKSPLRDVFLGTTAERIVSNVLVPSLIVQGPAETAYGNVLVAVDGSPSARRALRSAREFAPDASLTLLHVYYEAATDPEQSRTTAESLTQSELDAVLGANAREKVTALVRLGSFVETVTDQCRRENHDLLALGAHGRPSFARAIWGSRTLGILRDPPCDVLVGPSSVRGQ